MKIAATKLVALSLLLSPVAWADDEAKPTIREIPEAASARQLKYPIRSDAILVPKGASEEALLELAEADLDLACRKLGQVPGRALALPMHSSDIEELDRMTTYMGSSPVLSARCDGVQASVTKSGFAQAEGAVTFELEGKLASPEAADRRLYEVTIPVTLAAGWGTVESGKDAYQAACLALSANVGRDATIFSYCEKPAVEIKCCGNASLSGTFHALVYAYADPQWVSERFTASTPLAAAALASSHVAETAKKLGADEALSFCTPPSWEYAPTMAYITTCHTLSHKFRPSYDERVRCVAELGDGSKVWARMLEEGGVTKLAWIFKHPRFQSWTTDEAELSSDGTRLVAKTGSPVLTSSATSFAAPGSEPFAATLTGLDSAVKEAPASIELTCQAR